MSRGCKRGFTLVEAMVATVLLAVGVVAVLGALGAMTRTQTRLQERERMQTLAIQKYEELLATGEYSGAALSGDFSEWREDRYQWSAEVSATGVENLETLRVTVQPRLGGNASAEVEGAVFTPPIATDPEAAP